MLKTKKWILLLNAFVMIALIVSTIAIAYRDALNNDFLTMWDTYGYIVENTHIHALNWENIQWMFTGFYAANWHPLSWLSHAIDYALFGLNPWGHHLVNIIIHGLNTLLLFGLVIVLISFKPSSDNVTQFLPINNKTLLIAGIAAILFGIHPQHVESVVWVAERKDVLCLFFILLTLSSYVFYSAALVSKARLFWYASALFCFVLALLAKPMAVTLPVILLLMDVYPLNRTHLTALRQREHVSYKMLIIEKIPFFMFTGVSIILTLMAQSQGGIASLESMGLPMRFLNAFNSLIVYISKFLFPISLSPFYPLPAYTSFHEYYPGLIAAFAVFFITFLCGFLWYKKKYYWLIAWLFYLITLAPVIGIIQVGNQAAADRYVYLPTIPFYILLGVGIVNLLYSNKLLKMIKLGIVIAVMFIMGVLLQLTQTQTLVWKNDLTFWDHVVAYAPESALARFNLGTVYLHSGYYETAVKHYQVAISLEPDKHLWAANLPLAYIHLNRLQEALDMLNFWVEHQIDLGFSWDVIYYRQGLIYFKQGLLSKAQDALEKALQIKPENKRARNLLLKITISE
ncbi:MAG: tetratricopeptide repeat protein [Candidatus Parabeggiatoa sp.]|nr:tetratricopeptide repeat protein [Candidatus Parabeggiatoa sp.]